MSIFWRGSVHRWTGGRGGELHTPLGVYEEPVRRYLMGGPFPDDMVLVITVCTDGPSKVASSLQRSSEVIGLKGKD